MLRLSHLVRHLLLEVAELGALRDGVRHGELDHVVSAPEGNHIVENPRPGDLGRVLEVELLGLEVFFVEGGEHEGGEGGGGGEEGEVGEDVFFLMRAEVPEDGDAVGEYVHFGEGEGVGGDAGRAGGAGGVVAFAAGGAHGFLGSFR